MTIYNAEISAGSLLIPESRRISQLLLEKPSKDAWQFALEKENLLQKSPATAKRQARLIKKRLEKLPPEGLELILNGDREVATQILMASAILHSQLLGDFIRDVYAADIRKLETNLNQRQWDGFLIDCEHRDQTVEKWTQTTRKKLFQVIVRILAEAKYLDSTEKMMLTPPLLHPKTKSFLKRMGAHETLRRMELKK